MGHGDSPEGSRPGPILVQPQVSAYLYPWDLTGDPFVVSRLVSAGLRHVSVAAAYHSVRAATPQHPQHRFVVAETAALYRPVRSAVWAGRRLSPLGAPWTGREDSFQRAVDALGAGGLRVSAWVVLTHNSALGRRHRDLVVSNCFGDSYEWALCPANGEVREYAALLAAEAVRGLSLDGISLEACGQLGAEHGGHHDKTVGAYTTLAELILSICCCGACRRDWKAEGLDADATVQALREAFEAAQRHLVGVERHRKTFSARRWPACSWAAGSFTPTPFWKGCSAALQSVEPPLRVTLHAQPDPWATGASPGLTPTSARRATSCWFLSRQRPRQAGRDRSSPAAVPAGASVAAYVNLLAPIEPEDLEGQAWQLLHAGADELHLYHFGLANEEQLPLFSRLASLSA